jgi:DNA polymerase-1
MNWILIDCHNLAWRSFHSTGGLSYNGKSTGVTYGFLSEVVRLMGMYPDAVFVFCFDVGGSTARLKLFPAYKQRRHDANEECDQEELEARADVLVQLRRLRKRHLPSIGFKNILWQKGYECDDIIASVIQRSIGKEDTVLIASSDKDYRQLISGRVTQYSLQQGTYMTLQGFYKATGLRHPAQWATVLELAGCKTDEVPGIPSIGEATAIKYLTKCLPFHTKAFKTIKASMHIRERNRKLVCLPFEGTKTFQLFADNRVTMKAFKPVLRKLGIKQL